MKNKISVKIKAAVIDRATGKVVSRRPWQGNLIYDAALTGMAAGTLGGFAGLFNTCKVGNGTLINSVGPGATTFTQVGTTLTASTPGWFNTYGIGAGWLMKVGTGTGGQENYIVSVDATGNFCTLTDAASYTSQPFTAWNVAQTTLPGYLYNTSTYASTGNGTTFAGNVATMTRVFNFATQGSTYSVHCIGYSSSGATSNAVNGAIPLTSPDSVLPSQFYQVTIQVQYTVTPSAPTAVGNVTTGIDSSGTVALQVWDCVKVNNDGSSSYQQPSFASLLFDGNISVAIGLVTTGAVSLNSSINTGGNSPIGTYSSASVSWVATAGKVGVATATPTFSFSPSGETLYAIAFGASISTPPTVPSKVTEIFVLNFTTTTTLPTGTYSGNFVLTRTFGRTLTN